MYGNLRGRLFFNDKQLKELNIQNKELTMQTTSKLYSLIFASIFMVACSSNDTQEDMPEEDASTEQSTAEDGAENMQGSEGSEDGAAVSGTGDDADVSGEDIATDNTAQNAADMLTIYYFDFDQSSLNAETREALDIVASVLKNSNADVRLEGHADERGTREYNMALGERRANAIKSYLTVQGVPASRLEVISYGEEKPVMTGSDEASLSKNRRVELVK
jgi:peptidoglycan-associated lipoprotein